MVAVAEGVEVRVAYKAYASGAMTPNAEAVSTVDPGASGGQELRRVESTLELKKSTFKSNEIRSDRQIFDFRHGARSVTGQITGELSPKTYMDFLEAAMRTTKVDLTTVSLTPGNVTSLASDSGASTFTAASGDPVALGLMVGSIVVGTGFAAAGNNGINFVVTGFSGGSNRTIAVTPPPATHAADAAFTSLAAAGKSITPPSALANFISRKFAIEHYHPDITYAKLFTECRIGGFTLNMPATGLSTIAFDLMGRDMEEYTGGAAPFFNGPPGAITTTRLLAGVNGVLRAGGVQLGVATALSMKADLKPTVDAVVGQAFAPDIYLGRFDVSGQLTVLLEDDIFIDDFKNESEIDLLTYLTTLSTPAAADAMSVYLPRLKFTGASNPARGEAGQLITLPFQALLYSGATPGVPLATMQIIDNAA